MSKNKDRGISIIAGSDNRYQLTQAIKILQSILDDYDRSFEFSMKETIDVTYHNDPSGGRVEQIDLRIKFLMEKP